MQAHHVQAVVEILAETASLRFGLEIAVGGGDNPNIHRLGHAVTHAGDDVLLQGTQDLDLQGQRHLADLVQKQGALIGGLEAPKLVSHRAGEGAAHMAE